MALAKNGHKHHTTLHYFILNLRPTLKPPHTRSEQQTANRGGCMVKGGAKSSHGRYSTIITFYIDCATMVRRGGRRGREVEGMSGTSNRLRRVQLHRAGNSEIKCQWSNQTLPDLAPLPPHLSRVHIHVLITIILSTVQSRLY